MSYLQSLEDLASTFVTRSGDQGLEDVAACRVRGQSEEVSGAQRTQAAEEERAVFKLRQGLDQPRTVVANGSQGSLETTNR